MHLIETKHCEAVSGGATLALPLPAGPINFPGYSPPFRRPPVEV